MNIVFSTEIDRFLGDHHVMALATTGGKADVWVASLYYAFDREKACLLFFTSLNTRHGAMAAANADVAAAIAPQERDISRIAGLQLAGTAAQLFDKQADRARDLFLQAFPEITNIGKTPIWALAPKHIKMVDNKQGFGHKTEWPTP